MRSRSEQSQHIPKLAALWRVDVNVQHCIISASHKSREEKRWWENHHGHLFYRKDISLCCCWGEESDLHQLHGWLGKQAPEPQLLRTMLSLELIFLLWEWQQDINCIYMAVTTFWPPPDRAMLCYKGGIANTERNTTAQRQVGETSSVSFPECPSRLGSETLHV